MPTAKCHLYAWLAFSLWELHCISILALYDWELHCISILAWYDWELHCISILAWYDWELHCISILAWYDWELHCISILAWYDCANAYSVKNRSSLYAAVWSVDRDFSVHLDIVVWVPPALMVLLFRHSKAWRAYSSVVEHSTADREVLGSTPSVPCCYFFLPPSTKNL